MPMTKREIARNKMMLGALTMGDLHEVFLIRGEFTFGQNWLPIGETRRRNREIQFFMSGEAHPEFVVPIGTLVRVSGNTVRIPVERHNICGGNRDIEVLVRLEDVLFPEGTWAER